jgi:cellulose synthase/poly-beta-1,6-N-acetylglucosamine synthase-like glycosyltransferase
MPGHALDEAVFWTAAALMLYTYAGYPLLLWLLARLRPRPEPADLPSQALPSLSVLVAVYNEEAVIEAKLDNLAALDYPADHVEFLVGSDGSTDRTEALVRARGLPNLRLWAHPARRGKAAVLNDLVPQARGDMLLFTDANSIIEPPAARRLARHFADERVGGVCGRLTLRRPAAGRPGRLVVDEASYWQFESQIKRWEGQLGILAAANGAIYAIRRALFRPFPTRPAVAEDLFLPAMVLGQNALVTFEPQAVAVEAAPADTRTELSRKARNGELAYNLVPHLLPLLAPWRGRVAWMLWSHKIIRWLAPFLLLALLAASLALWAIPFYRACLLAQLLGYASALAGYWLDARHRLPAWLSAPYYFAGGNTAMLVGFFRSLSRSTSGMWVRLGR